MLMYLIRAFSSHYTSAHAFLFGLGAYIFLLCLLLPELVKGQSLLDIYSLFTLIYIVIVK